MKEGSAINNLRFKTYFPVICFIDMQSKLVFVLMEPYSASCPLQRELSVIARRRVDHSKQQKTIAKEKPIFTVDVNFCLLVAVHIDLKRVFTQHEDIFLALV